MLLGFKPKSKVTVFTWMFCNVTWILKVTVFVHRKKLVYKVIAVAIFCYFY